MTDPRTAVPPKAEELRLRTADLLDLYDGSVAALAEAIAPISVQAIYRWGEFVPKQRVYQALVLHPQLRRKCVRRPVKFKRVVKRTVSYVRVR